MNVIYDDAKRLAESKGWTLLALTRGEANADHVCFVSVCCKQAPWRAEEDEVTEYANYGTEYFTHHFYWRNNECFFEAGNYMMRSFQQAVEDAQKR